jgi:hypothetical protein
MNQNTTLPSSVVLGLARRMDVVRITGMAFFKVKTGFMGFFLMSYTLFPSSNYSLHVAAGKIHVRASFSKMAYLCFLKGVSSI